MKLLKIQLMSLGLLCMFVSGMGMVNAQTCTIQGMNLITMETKARGNGFQSVCVARAKAKGGPLNLSIYSIPSPAKIGCKGISRMGRGYVNLRLYRNRLHHGWTISNTQARGRPNVVMKSYNRVKMNLPGVGHHFDVYVTKVFLKHPTKSCHNIQAVLTDAFGQ